MIYALNEEARNYLETVFTYYEGNRMIAEALNAYFSSDHKLDSHLGYRKAFLKHTGISSLDGYQELLQEYSLNEIKPLVSYDYSETPYFHKFDNSIYEYDDVTLGRDNYEKEELFLSNEIYGDEENYFKEISPLSYFKDGYNYPLVKKGSKVWMSLIPHEINTMKDMIAQAEGNVLTLGLGIGYFAYMASMKEEVKSVTIVDYDPKVIQMFKAVIFPKFEHKEKIKIIEADGIEFLKKEDLRNYDFIFSDIWYRENDGLPLYAKLKKIENEKGLQEKSAYWIEKSILAYFRRYLITLMEEENDGFSDDNYPESKSFEDSVMRKLHFYLKEKKLESEEDVRSLLSDDSLKQIVTCID